MSAPARTTIPVIKSHNPSNHIVIIVVVITTLTFLTVCARLYTKVTKHTFGPDDWAIIPALVGLQPAILAFVSLTTYLLISY